MDQDEITTEALIVILPLDISNSFPLLMAYFAFK